MAGKRNRDWKLGAVKSSEKKFSSKQVSLRNLKGELCSMQEVSNVQADQYEKSQWKINTTDDNISELRSREHSIVISSNNEVIFNMQDISANEVVDASKTMKNKKSDKPNKIPNEAWTLIVQDCDVAQKLAEFFSTCFKNAVMPK